MGGHRRLWGGARRLPGAVRGRKGFAPPPFALPLAPPAGKRGSPEEREFLIMAPRWQPETTNQLHPVQVLTSSGDAALPMGFKPWGVPVWSSQCVWLSLLLDGRFGSVDQQDTPETHGATLAKWVPHLSGPTAKASRSQIRKLHGKQLSGQPSPGTKRPLGEMFGLQSLGSHSRKFFLRLRQQTSLRNWSKDEVDGNLG